MKAPSKVDKFLREEGFGYGKPYYQRLHSSLPLLECVVFGRQKSGLIIYLLVAYIDHVGGVQISPTELDVMYLDGRFSALPSANEKDGFWDPKATDEMVEMLLSKGQEHLNRLADPVLMVQTFDYLLANEPGANCPVQFPELRQPWVSRRASPHRLKSKAAYLNLMGRFEDSKKVLAQVPGLTSSESKILGDAETCEIRHIEDARAYLKGIGARTN